MANLDELHESAAAHRNSTAFEALKGYNLARVEGYRDRLEREDDAHKIWDIQGRIKECREQLKLLSE